MSINKFCSTCCDTFAALDKQIAAINNLICDDFSGMYILVFLTDVREIVSCRCQPYKVIQNRLHAYFSKFVTKLETDVSKAKMIVPMTVEAFKRYCAILADDMSEDAFYSLMATMPCRTTTRNTIKLYEGPVFLKHMHDRIASEQQIQKAKEEIQYAKDEITIVKAELQEALKELNSLRQLLEKERTNMKEFETDAIQEITDELAAKVAAWKERDEATAKAEAATKELETLKSKFARILSLTDCNVEEPTK